MGVIEAVLYVLAYLGPMTVVPSAHDVLNVHGMLSECGPMSKWRIYAILAVEGNFLVRLAARDSLL